MSTFIDNTEDNKETDNNPKKKVKNDTVEELNNPHTNVSLVNPDEIYIEIEEKEQLPNNPFMGLSLINPDNIEENLLLYKPKHKVGEKFIMNDTEFIIRQIIMDYDKNKEIQLYKYVFVPSRGQSYHNYKDTAYDIDRMIGLKEIRDIKGQPLGGKHKSRRRRKSRKFKKSRKSRKCRK